MALQDAVTEKIVGAIASDSGKLKRSRYSDAWSKDAASLKEYDYYLGGHDKLLQYTPERTEEAYRIWNEGMGKVSRFRAHKIQDGVCALLPYCLRVVARREKRHRRLVDLAKQGMASENLSPLERKLGHWLGAYAHLVEHDFSDEK